jgi:acyl-coenzyme A thioesterase PaaI-like protein
MCGDIASVPVQVKAHGHGRGSQTKEDGTSTSMLSTVEREPDDAQALHAVPHSRCVVCGRDNTHGLQIQYSSDAAGATAAAWTPTAAWEGFRGIIHGGIVATVLDEAMSKAVAATNCEALTGELRVRYRRTVVTGEILHVRGWIVKRAKRLVTTEASLTATDGSERAHAWASFLTLPRRPD